MGYMKDSVNTEADDQYGADQACDDESAAVPDKRGMEYVFQYQTAKINDSDYQQNIDESSEKIVTCMLENTVQVGRLFDEKAGEQGCCSYYVNSYKGSAKCHCLKKSVTGAHPSYHPTDNVCIDQDV